MALGNPDLSSRGPQGSVVTGTQVEGETQFPSLASSELGQISRLFAPIPELFSSGEGREKLDGERKQIVSQVIVCGAKAFDSIFGIYNIEYCDNVIC